MLSRMLGVAVLLLAGSAVARAQTIDPGMSKEQVIEKLGKPASERTHGSFTYLFYVNGCERRCGMNDMVTLENDAVTDAIFRTNRRQFSGTSSSPNGVRPERTRMSGGGEELNVPAEPGSARRGGVVTGNPTTPAPAAAAPASVGGVSVEPSAPLGGASVFQKPVNPETQPGVPDDTLVRGDARPTLRTGGPANPKPGDVLSPADSAELRRLRARQQGDTTKLPDPPRTP